MRNLLSGVIVAVATAGAAPVLGAETAKTTPAATAKPSSEVKSKEKVVCTKDEVAGSLIPKRVCRTQAQVDAQLQAIEDLNKERREIGGLKPSDLSMTPSGTQSGR
jgi:hypothetical protein